MNEQKDTNEQARREGEPLSAADLQEANATGARNNEQGQASFITGSTTGGGSNHGQGSSHLGGESYRQGDTTNSGSNYSNEAAGLGRSTVGTSDEGASASQDPGTRLNTGYEANTPERSSEPKPGKPGEPRANEHEPEVPEEGERRDASLNTPSNDRSAPGASGGRQQSGSWSLSSTDSA